MVDLSLGKQTECPWGVTARHSRAGPQPIPARIARQRRGHGPRVFAGSGLDDDLQSSQSRRRGDLERPLHLVQGKDGGDIGSSLDATLQEAD